MKLLVIGFLSVFANLAVAGDAVETAFSICTGDHHGHYVDFYSSKAGKVTLSVSTDGEKAAKLYTVVEVQKSFKAVAEKNYKNTVIQAVTDLSDEDLFSGSFVLVKAQRGNSTLYVNLNNYNKQNFLVIDGIAELVNCSLEK